MIQRSAIAAAILFWSSPGPALAANPDGDLRIEVIAAYNLVVDSNVESPSTYAPRSAYLGATYYNDGTNPLTDVWAYIGDYTNGTPGTYPSRYQAPYNGPLPGDQFALTHEGGALGTADATRYLGTIPPGESVTVYWLVSYPNVDEDGHTVAGGVKPADDLWLQYDVWGTALDGAAPLQANETRTVTMRNEISAMANKIFPNGANKVPQEYQDLLNMYVPSWTNKADDGTPGTFIDTEGVWYDLGNVGAGFDNDGDLVPDRNAWLQPVGDASIFDPSCFRLVHTYALVIVKLNDGTERVYNVEDQLYFENIPENNNGAVGYVRYEFLSLRGGCSSTLTPYQEVASGYDNEKFNGDYGATLGQSLSSGTSRVDIAKSASPATTPAGSAASYAIPFTNSGLVAVGQPDLFMPLVVQDAIPAGTLYVAGSAAASNTLPAGVTNCVVYYSTNDGGNWSATEPVPATNLTHLQWWLSNPLQPGAAGTVKFQVTVKSPYTNANPQVPNTAGLSLGNTYPFQTATAATLVPGVNVLGDLVWRDDGTGTGGLLGNQIQDGTETGITGVTVRAYYDLNTNGVIDAGDFLYAATTSGVSGAYGFTSLPDGYYVVQVDSAHANVPSGYSPTTATNWSISLDPARTNGNAVTNLTADFGFAPALTLTKTLASTNAFREGQSVSYNLMVSNNLPGDGQGSTFATTYVWATNGAQSGTEWINYTNAYVPPGQNGLYASNRFAGASKILYLTNFPGFTGGAVTNVELLMPIIGASAAAFSQNGSLLVEVMRLAPAATIYSATYLATNTFTNTTLRMWTIPMTGAFAWVGTDFATNYRVALTSEKNSGSAGTGYLQVDAVGFRITSVSTGGTGSASTTLNPVPLTDRYDADQFQFVSANPAATTATTSGTPPGTTGTLYWANLGPIYPGGAATSTVTFKLLKPENYTNQVVTNFAWVTNATFQNGTRANSATSSVVTTQTPAGTIGDYVWRDLNGDGVQNETNTGIAGVAVSITRPRPSIWAGARASPSPISRMRRATIISSRFPPRACTRCGW